MKVVVLAKFKDKNSGKIHKKGETMTISKARYEEILKVGKFVEEVAKDEAPEDEKPEDEPAAE